MRQRAQNRKLEQIRDRERIRQEARLEASARLVDHFTTDEQLEALLCILEGAEIERRLVKWIAFDRWRWLQRAGKKSYVIKKDGSLRVE